MIAAGLAVLPNPGGVWAPLLLLAALAILGGYAAFAPRDDD